MRVASTEPILARWSGANATFRLTISSALPKHLKCFLQICCGSQGEI